LNDTIIFDLGGSLLYSALKTNFLKLGWSNSQTNQVSASVKRNKIGSKSYYNSNPPNS